MRGWCQKLNLQERVFEFLWGWCQFRGEYSEIDA